jgi:hypothetical protein
VLEQINDSPEMEAILGDQRQPITFDPENEEPKEHEEEQSDNTDDPDNSIWVTPGSLPNIQPAPPSAPPETRVPGGNEVRELLDRYPDGLMNRHLNRRSGVRRGLGDGIKAGGFRFIQSLVEGKSTKDSLKEGAVAGVTTGAISIAAPIAAPYVATAAGAVLTSPFWGPVVLCGLMAGATIAGVGAVYLVIKENMERNRPSRSYNPCNQNRVNLNMVQAPPASNDIPMTDEVSVGINQNQDQDVQDEDEYDDEVVSSQPQPPEDPEEDPDDSDYEFDEQETDRDKFDRLGYEGNERNIRQVKKSMRTYNKRLAEHVKKRDDYLRDPDSFDHRGYLRNATQEVRDSVIRERVQHLNKEIRNFNREINVRRNLLRALGEL